MADKSAFELERDRRVEENKRKMQALGLDQAAAALAADAKPAKPARKRVAKPPAELLERRVSERPRKEVNYAEMEARVAREVKEPIDYSERIKAVTLDAEKAEQLRADLEAKRGSKKVSGKSRGPVDSGKGVRIQGGRVYDSAHGVTCHWCRQKTLEDHVTCTNPSCGNGRRMPLSFCAKCLRNRHGEDFEAADAGGGWWCPTCRGSCGPGCVTCCNCGPCRKKAGLEPTHQVVKLARDAGFDNVHDYLVHLVTGEAKEEIAERKLQHSWGAWLKADGSEASEQTGAGRDGAGDAGCSSQEHAHEQEEQEQAGSDGEAAADTAAPPKDQRATSRRRGRKASGGKAAGGSRSGKAAAGSSGKAAAGKSAGRKRKAAAAVEQADEEEQQQQPSQQQPLPDGDAAEELGVDCEDAPLLSSQDSKLTRKQRIMQSMGLAPVTVCA